nr:replication protein A 70 kDa DNA-binding subunit D-like [Ipomoea batatas]
MGRIKVVEKSGEVKICSSYDATKLLFNENTLEFVEFRNSLSMHQQTPLKNITSNSTFSYGTISGVESSTKMQITTLSEIFSKREADELKAMQPSVMTKVPKDIRNLKGRGPSRLSNDLTDKNRTPLQDISLTVNMNRERENENSIQDENAIGSKHNRLSSIQTPKQLFGVFQSSLVTPLSVLTEGPSRLSNDLIDKTRAPLQDIPATLNMNRERDSSFQSTSSTITNAMRSSTMEFRNLNNDFEEAMEEQDLTNNESIG